MSYEFNFTNKKDEFFGKLRNNYRVTPDNYSTHTSIGDPPGAWHISDEYLDYFKYADLEFDKVKKGKEFLSKWKSQLDNM